MEAGHDPEKKRMRKIMTSTGESDWKIAEVIQSWRKIIEGQEKKALGKQRKDEGRVRTYSSESELTVN
jgi:hypothetical protein